MWKKTGKSVDGFPVTSNSRHLRKSANALVQESGSAELKRTVPQVLNHTPSTNSRSYLSMTRGKLVGRAKSEINRLRALDGEKNRPSRQRKVPSLLQDYETSTIDPTKDGKPKRKDASLTLSSDSRPTLAPPQVPAPSRSSALSSSDRPTRNRHLPEHLSDFQLLS